ncbi:hypothetical protein [Filomicrobium sp.]|uniref:hypothetical protein n=1 Tax=Filomicrobium sp. TaxID=2024831 RepID=UPI00258A9B30|nr:hypothetical protein [Filomicrobium sp.]MCV0371106.1 hypothetical protein [Filomicrobium sp.]
MPTDLPRWLTADILRAVAEEFAVAPSRIVDHVRGAQIDRARQAVIWIAVRGGRGPTPIGRVLDRDPSTVRTNYITAGCWLDHDAGFKARVLAAIDRLRRGDLSSRRALDARFGVSARVAVPRLASSVPPGAHP